MKRVNLIAIFVGLLAIGILAGCTGGETPADTSGVKTPEQAKAEGLPTPESAVGAGGGTTAGGPTNMETGA